VSSRVNTNSKKMSLEQFRCVAVLGRGHFGKVCYAFFTHLCCSVNFYNAVILAQLPAFDRKSRVSSLLTDVETVEVFASQGLLN